MTPVCHAEARPFSARLQIVAAGCACAAAAAYVYAVDPAQGVYPPCLFYHTTGLYCAGCGATRALHALFHGRLAEALRDNLLFVSLLPLVLAGVGLYAWRAWQGNAWPRVTLETPRLLRTGLGFLLVAAVFMALRNLPCAPFDLLRPL